MIKIKEIENITSLEEAELFLLEKSDEFSDVLSNDALDWLDTKIGDWVKELEKLEHEIKIKDRRSISQYTLNRAIGLHFLVKHANVLYEESMVKDEALYEKFDELETNGFYLDELDYPSA